MANKTEERILNLFQEASGGRGSDTQSTPSNDLLDAGPESRVADSSTTARPNALTDSGTGASNSEGEESSSYSGFNASLDSGAGQDYQGTSGSRGSQSASSGGGGNALESLAGSLFGGALGLVPLVSSVVGLFGGKSTQAPVLQKYEMPSPISFEAASTGSGLSNSDYGQMGLPRVYDSSDTGASSGEGVTSATQSASTAQTASSASGTGSNSGESASGTPQISVNVQAMDAQSFMSYSGEIAKAVRDAMLNLSSINDVVSEL